MKTKTKLFILGSILLISIVYLFVLPLVIRFSNFDFYLFAYFSFVIFGTLAYFSFISALLIIKNMKNEAKKTDERTRAIFLNGFREEYVALNDGPISNRSINNLSAYQRILENEVQNQISSNSNSYDNQILREAYVGLNNRNMNNIRAYQRGVGYANEYGESYMNSVIADLRVREAMLRPPQALYFREGTMMPISQEQKQIEETMKMETKKDLQPSMPSKPKNITLFSFLEI